MTFFGLRLATFFYQKNMIVRNYASSPNGVPKLADNQTK
jgi:hypothetical protein